eukprot:6891095-Alexandrium_andersonii.AAC.1
MPTDVLKTHLDRQVSLKANGDRVSGEAAYVYGLGRPFPSRGALCPARAVEVHQLGELVVVRLAWRSGRGAHGPADARAACLPP